jgi:hypothetical protein
MPRDHCPLPPSTHAVVHYMKSSSYALAADTSLVGTTLARSSSCSGSFNFSNNVLHTWGGGGEGTGEGSTRGAPTNTEKGKWGLHDRPGQLVREKPQPGAQQCVPSPPVAAQLPLFPLLRLSGLLLGLPYAPFRLHRCARGGGTHPPLSCDLSMTEPTGEGGNGDNKPRRSGSRSVFVRMRRFTISRSRDTRP